ncbi:hypothetical protein AK812_SmicGene23520 [Symbiodinium microadriaticum]|uniref:Uncharacterized protein n=1 Tax=Symbiodinium microadriaticum TaxID=2951 RepID=A0A1Q9DGZ2_SYMMI|nr:hypothetical protein AK812_SmicGene23520 [Symbiodinium microadriaticum]
MNQDVQEPTDEAFDAPFAFLAQLVLQASRARPVWHEEAEEVLEVTEELASELASLLGRWEVATMKMPRNHLPMEDWTKETKSLTANSQEEDEDQKHPKLMKEREGPQKGKMEQQKQA